MGGAIRASKGMKRRRGIDPITLEVIREGLVAIVREMRANMIRSALSSAVCELYDLSCALVDDRAQLVAQSEDNPQHIFPLLWSVRLVLDRFGRNIRPGDIFIHNDPYEGGTHLNDIAMIYPVFAGGRPLLFSVVRAHWEDVGGMTAGSISGQATEIYQEGLRIPPIRVYERGRPNQAFLETMFLNMRMPEERQGDFRAMVGTCRIGERRVRGLLRRLGADVLRAGVVEMLDREEARIRQKIAQLPRGEHRYELYLDPRPDLPEPLVIRVRVQTGDGITVDFTGSSRQMRGPYNLGESGAPTGVFMVLKSLLDPSSPVNSGSFRPIRVIAPQGTFLNATPPAAVGAMGDVRRSLESALIGALARVIPDAVAGDTKGSSNQVLLSGRDREKNGRVFLLYEAPSGGTGGFLEEDGNNTLRTFHEGDFTAIQPIEAVENKFPVLVERTELRQDSCGHGRHRGGLGMRRVIRLLADEGAISFVSDKNVVPPFGVHSGFSGGPNRFGVSRDGRELTLSGVPGKVSGFPLKQDDRILEQSSGGGGYGDPLEREPARVASDVAEGYISLATAEAAYGVILRDGRVDLEATEARRRELQEQRILLQVERLRGEESPGGYRAVVVAPSTAEALQAKAGDLVECLALKHPGAPLRAWLRIDPGLPRESCRLGLGGLAALGLREGERTWVRKVVLQ